MKLHPGLVKRTECKCSEHCRGLRRYESLDPNWSLCYCDHCRDVNAQANGVHLAPIDDPESNWKRRQSISQRN